MIRFDLSCENDHRFESWFASNAACEKLLGAKMVNCTTCGSTAVVKALMAPRVPAKSNKAVAAEPKEQPLEKLKREVEANSEYVGMSFATQARDMHDGIVEERPIYGEAKLDEAKKLVEDGIPVVPLPFMPTKKVN